MQNSKFERSKEELVSEYPMTARSCETRGGRQTVFRFLAELQQAKYRVESWDGSEVLTGDRLRDFVDRFLGISLDEIAEEAERWYVEVVDYLLKQDGISLSETQKDSAADGTQTIALTDDERAVLFSILSTLVGGSPDGPRRHVDSFIKKLGLFDKNQRMHRIEVLKNSLGGYYIEIHEG